MRAKGYITEWDGLRYETLRAVRNHVFFLSKRDQEGVNGCPVLKDNGELAGYLRIRYKRDGVAVPVIARR